ncbi:CshA/CshB family fibrillar adhesin-related protein [Cellulosilyticum ruminicola]|uniref:CshA/CshB family fibrillar adhesin-related protein n=1 Tax=Cellulosilyticum ruminicola TaxID=425254 RepID=UPI0006CF805C|nr:CshA/CshB family fibrillar adhesin-related protein [Cellulosilyticum ruminicola]
MLQVQYAASNSKGILASNIGWIDFGTLLSLSQHSPTATVTNAITGGYLISFDLCLSTQGNTTSLNQIKFEGTTIPTSTASPFGNTAYTGIPGHVALYMTNASVNGDELNVTLALRNITVTDTYGDIINDYFIIAADAAITRQHSNFSPEVWSVTTDGSPWELVEEIPSLSGFTSGTPSISGLNTRTVTEVGNTSSRESTSAGVFITQSPCQVTAKTTIVDSRQGFAFGVIIPQCKNCTPLAAMRSNHINYINPTHYVTSVLPLKSCDKLTSIDYNGKNHSFNGTPLLIAGQLGNYLFFDNCVLFSGSSRTARMNFDIFHLTIARGNECIQKFIVFSTKPRNNRDH